jgi:hypothetical protein
MSPYVLSLCTLRLSEFLGISTRGAPLALPSFAVGSVLEYPSRLFLSVRRGLIPPWATGGGGFKEALMGRPLYPMILWPTLLRYTPEEA